jgi:superfamily II DNA helicase RecQ
VQETGQAGRDGEGARAILYEGETGSHCTIAIKKYASNNEQRMRQFLFSAFICHFKLQ